MSVSPSVENPAYEPWFAIDARADGVVVVTRSNVPFASIAEVERGYGAAVAHLESLERRGLSLLVDLRRAPSRNDPAFETAVAPHRRRMFSAFSKRGVVVRSLVGKMQIERHATEDGHSLEVFVDFAAALRALARP